MLSKFLMPVLLLFILNTFFTTAYASNKVVVTIKPLHSITSNLLKGIDKPVLLMNNLQSPHHFNLKPSQARLIKSAQLVVWMGENIESSLTKILNKLSVNNRVSFPHQNTHTEDKHYHENQHYWLDPVKMILFANAIQLKLHKVYPQEQLKIQANFAQLKKQLMQLNTDIKNKLHNKELPFITLHNDLVHFNARYKLTQLASLQISDHQKPSLKHVLKIKRLLAASADICIIYNPVMPKKWLNIINGEHKNKVIKIETLGRNLQKGETLYFELMHNLSNALLKCAS